MTAVTRAPRKASLLITRECNLSCGHCGVMAGSADLPLSVWEAILDRLAEARVLELTISGGEPLCRKDFHAFIQMVLDRPFRFSLNTNATGLTPDIAAFLGKAGSRFTSVMAGLDGPDSETHDGIRGPGVFERAVKGIRTALEAGLAVVTNCTVNPMNWSKVAEIAEFTLQKVGVRGSKFTPMLAARHGIPPRLHLTPGMLVAAGRALEPLERKGLAVFGPLPDIYHMALDAASGKLPASRGRAFGCGGCRGKVVIASDGAVIPCDYLDDIVLGRLPDMTFDEIMQSSPTLSFISMVDAPRALHPQCSRCGFLQVCSGGCPVNPLLRGDPSGKDDLSCLKMLVEAL